MKVRVGTWGNREQLALLVKGFRTITQVDTDSIDTHLAWLIARGAGITLENTNNDGFFFVCSSDTDVQLLKGVASAAGLNFEKR